LGLAFGIVCGGLLDWLAGSHRARSEWARFAFRIVAAAMAVAILVVLREAEPDPPPSEMAHLNVFVPGPAAATWLDAFGPGPTLAGVEAAVVGPNGLPALTTWPVVFAAKFAVLAIPMGLSGLIAAFLLRGRKVK
jgi:hypothetical protein